MSQKAEKLKKRWWEWVWLDGQTGFEKLCTGVCWPRLSTRLEPSQLPTGIDWSRPPILQGTAQHAGSTKPLFDFAAVTHRYIMTAFHTPLRPNYRIGRVRVTRRWSTVAMYRCSFMSNRMNGWPLGDQSPFPVPTSPSGMTAGIPNTSNGRLRAMKHSHMEWTRGASTREAM